MSKRNERGYAAALALSAIVTLIVGYVGWGWGLTSWQRADAERSAYQRAAYTEEYIERTCIGMERPALIECIQEAIKASREDQRAGYDLKAQENMAIWAWWLLMTSIATVFTAGIGIYYLRETLLSARADSDIAREMGQAQVRAYLNIQDLTMGCSKNEDLVVVRISCRNTGQSPASSVETICDVSLLCSGNHFYTFRTRIGFPDIPGATLEKNGSGMTDYFFPISLWQEVVFIQAYVAVFSYDVFRKEISTIEAFILRNPEVAARVPVSMERTTGHNPKDFLEARRLSMREGWLSPSKGPVVLNEQGQQTE